MHGLTGEPVWLHQYVVPVMDADGSLLRQDCVVMDITQQKRTEGALRESERLFRMLTESSLAGVFIIQDMAFKYVNPAFMQITGFSEQSVLRMHALDLAHPDDRDMVSGLVRRQFSGETDSVQYACRIISKTGAILHVSVLGRLVTFNGRPAIMGTMLDVTQQTLTEEATRASEALYRSLVELSPDAITMGDVEGRITMANQATGACSDMATCTNSLAEGLWNSWCPKNSPGPRITSGGSYKKAQRGTSGTRQSARTAVEFPWKPARA